MCCARVREREKVDPLMKWFKGKFAYAHNDTSTVVAVAVASTTTTTPTITTTTIEQRYPRIVCVFFSFRKEIHIFCSATRVFVLLCFWSIRSVFRFQTASMVHCVDRLTPHCHTFIPSPAQSPKLLDRLCGWACVCFHSFSNFIPFIHSFGLLLFPL